jgi:hypothetical protein
MKVRLDRAYLLRNKPYVCALLSLLFLAKKARRMIFYKRIKKVRQWLLSAPQKRMHKCLVINRLKIIRNDRSA